MLKYANFPYTQFNCLRCPLETVNAYQSIQTLKARKKNHENKLEVLANQMRGLEDCVKVKETYAAIVNNIVQFDKLSDEERKCKLSDLMPALVKSVRYQTGNSMNLAVELLGLYGRFDSVFFADVMQMPCGADVDAVAVTAQMEHERRLIERTGKEIERAWEDAAEQFTSVPLVWADDVPRHVPEADHNKIRRRNVERIIEAFVREWRVRAPLFTDAVTIDGIRIGSLPADRRAKWAAAYDKLGLAELPKRLYFAMKEFEHRGPQPPAEEPSAPHNLFQTVVG